MMNNDISEEQAIKSLESQGYSNISIRFKDGEWKGTADKNSERFKVHVDPHTGAITKSKKDT
ncbi:PepSY domain-containing protein [archaeon]|nr:MAG: PepSY domain-containing protein [archaeon]